MRFKTFTQAYFLIKNNPNYAKSLGDRAQNVIFWSCLGAVWFLNSLKMGLPANDKICWFYINASLIDYIQLLW